MEMYKKGKIKRRINYADIKEVVLIKNWQNNVFINCKPIGVNIYKVSDEICNKIKEITSKKEEDTDEFINFFINRHTTNMRIVQVQQEHYFQG